MPMTVPGPAAAPDPVRRRERGLRRVGTTTRRTATAATAATLLLGAGYAHALPGTSHPASGAAQHSTRDHPRPPANAPASTTQPAQTTTGAS
ncbi:hypothetical protein HEP84_40595 [Streptomyces sp. RLB1-33]|uniref:hypothetical protein n=1 Tax=Streptomyces mirabilis TaxID=68239 RepID=UPI00143EE394|nr:MULTISPECIES: hypothetical protein [Streptomyces]QIY67940.1 hypothetical protein HEP84_40595 [Streptomyces sp. RLB1-33]QUW78387.1 hypothetical protein SMIR_03900 [Streptomyces mirabilis]